MWCSLLLYCLHSKRTTSGKCCVLYFSKSSGIFRETLSKRGVRVITGLGKYFREIDKKRNGLLSRAALKEALKVFHLEMPEGVSLAEAVNMGIIFLNLWNRFFSLIKSIV